MKPDVVQEAGLRSQSILYMDDDRDMRELSGLLLAHFGHRVVGCVDVDEAVAHYAEALARGERFDLVILDLSIPGKRGGVEGMQEILALDPEARVVACSGCCPWGSGDLPSGFVGFVEKPFTPDSLKQIVGLR